MPGEAEISIGGGGSGGGGGGTPGIRAPWNGLRWVLWTYAEPGRQETGEEADTGTYLGPAITAPWRRPVVRPTASNVLQPLPPPPPPPARIGQGNFKPLVPRDPRDDPRVRRHTEAVEAILNSLLRTGDVRQTGVSEFRINKLPYRVGRAPTVDDDELDGVEPGDLWLDTSANRVYINVVATAGVAVWVLIGG